MPTSLVLLELGGLAYAGDCTLAESVLSVVAAVCIYGAVVQPLNSVVDRHEWMSGPSPRCAHNCPLCHCLSLA